jgi:hypothetical protein
MKAQDMKRLCPNIVESIRKELSPSEVLPYPKILPVNERRKYNKDISFIALQTALGTVQRHPAALFGVGVQEIEVEFPVKPSPDFIRSEMVGYVIATQQWKSSSANLIKKLLIDFCIYKDHGEPLEYIVIYYSDLVEVRKVCLKDWDYLPFLNYVRSLVDGSD